MKKFLAIALFTATVVACGGKKPATTTTPTPETKGSETTTAPTGGASYGGAAYGTPAK